jgi:hypothetical protein
MMPKGLGEAGGVLAAGLVVQVTLGRRVVLVAHVGLDRVGIERRDRGGAEAVAQVVEAKPAKARPVERGVVAPAKVVVTSPTSTTSSRSPPVATTRWRPYVLAVPAVTAAGTEDGARRSVGQCPAGQL